MSDKGNPNGYPTRDWSTRKGAEALGRKIEDYWAARGRRVDAIVFDMGGGFWAVRSSLRVTCGINYEVTT